MSTFVTKQAMQVSGITRESLQSLQGHDLDMSIGIRWKQIGREYTVEGCAKLLLIHEAMSTFGIAAKVAGKHLLHAEGLTQVTTPTGVTITYDIPKATEEVRRRAASLGFYQEAAE